MSKKRGQNEGSIYQRPDGKWVGVISAGYRNGKRVRRYLYGATKDVVHRQVVETLRNQHLGLNVTPQKQSVEHFLNHWLEDVARPRVRATTYRSYEQIIRNHLIPGLGENVHPRVVMDVLGHSQINLTLGTYSHVVAKIQQEAIAQIEDVFKPPKAAQR